MRFARRKTLVFVALGMAGLPVAAQQPPPAVTPPPVAQPRFTIKAEKGFVDDPFALDPDAGLLGVLLTDAASYARLELIDLKTGKPRKTIEVGDPQRLFERIVFAGGNKGVVLISRDASSGKRSAQYFDAEGKPAGLLGPFTDFGVAERAGQRFLVAWSREMTSAGDAVYTVARHRLDGLAKVGKSVALTMTKGRELKKPPLRAADWQDGYTQLIGLRPGDYDKKKDVRMPDRAALYDVLSGAFTWEADVADVYAWAAGTELRRKLPGRSLFAVFSPDARLFDLVDAQGRRGPLALPVPLKMYDPTTLQEQEDRPGTRLVFGLAVDPLHPEALARRKKDASYLDLYAANVEASAAGATANNKESLRFGVARLLRAPMAEGPVAWRVEGPFAAVLRKHKSFSRGGTQLELYPLN